MPVVIDSDQHLFEYRGLWHEHIDPALRGDAIELDRRRARQHLARWPGRVLGVADVQDPGETDAIGERRRRERAGLPPLRRYDDALPRDYWEPRRAPRSSPRSASTKRCCSRTTGSAGSASSALVAPRAAREHRARGTAGARPSPRRAAGACIRSLHLHLGDLDWLAAELAAAARAGLRLAMIAPALVDGVAALAPVARPRLGRCSSSTGSRPCSTSRTSRGRSTTPGTPTASRRRARARVGVPLDARRARGHRPDRERRVRRATRICGSGSSSSPQSGCRCT